MKKLLWLLTAALGLVWLIGAVVIITYDLHMLEPEEQQKLKEGKQFWEWPSPFGPLNMHYVEKGEGSEHILLIHGFRAHTYTWRHLLDPLSQAGYHVWAIDLVGFGFSDKPENVPYDLGFFSQQVDAFMEAHNISKAHLIGNSMGGGIVLKLALSYPHRTSSLILLSALGYPLDLPLYLSIGRHISQIWAPFLGPTIIRCCLNQLVFNQSIVTDEQVDAYCLPYRFPGGVRSSLLTLRKFDNDFLIEMGKDYAGIFFPTLVIWGDRDWLIPLSHYEKFLNDFPNGKSLLIPDCGHLPQEETPQIVMHAIHTFLSEIDSKSIFSENMNNNSN